MGAVENRKVVNDLYAALGPQDTLALAALVAEDEEDRSDVLRIAGSWPLAFATVKSRNSKSTQTPKLLPPLTM